VADVPVAVPNVKSLMGSRISVLKNEAAPPNTDPAPTSNREVEAFATPKEDVADVPVAFPNVNKLTGSKFTVLWNTAAPAVVALPLILKFVIVVEANALKPLTESAPDVVLFVTVSHVAVVEAKPLRPLTVIEV